MKKLAPYLVLVCVSALLYLLSIRGSAGNPTPYQIEFELNSSGKSFETSQERSRWALILSLYHNRSFAIDQFASMGTPDIGYIKGHYYSFFPPGASIIALPFFAIGRMFGLSQLAVFSVPALFALATMLLIYKFCSRFNLHWTVGLFSAFAYGFATSTWAYSVTFYAHVISGFLILSGLYLTCFDAKRSFLRVAAVWLFYVLAVWIDYPNIFIYFPIALGLSLNFISITPKNKNYLVDLRIKYLVAPLIFLAGIGLYGYYNFINFGSPLAFSNAIPRIQDLKDIEKSIPESARNAGQSLDTRNMLNGLYTFFLSHDRSLAVYTPATLLFLFGLGYLLNQDKKREILILSVPATCLTLYIMFGDPYGGWSFGSRYIVATMPELIILAGLGLQRFAANIYIKLIYTLVIGYSAAVNLMAALTTNVIPPYVEARHLGLDSTYIINWRMILGNHLSSFFYNTLLGKSVPAIMFYAAIGIVLIILFSFLIWYPKYDRHHQ